MLYMYALDRKARQDDNWGDDLGSVWTKTYIVVRIRIALPRRFKKASISLVSVKNNLF